MDIIYCRNHQNGFEELEFNAFCETIFFLESSQASQSPSDVETHKNITVLKQENIKHTKKTFSKIHG